MKKVLSFVLVLSMILGSFGMAFAAPADVVGKDYEDAVNVLVELGVVAGYEDGSYRPENVVTRAEMATFIVKALGLADYAVGKSAFTDMAGHWADPFVAYAASLGFVAGNTDGTFNPNATVSYDQAITMLVQALGYKAEYMVGGYPGAFVNQAKTLGMLKGVKSGVAGANRGDVATLLFNTLGCDFVRYDADGRLQSTVIAGTEIADNMLKRLGAEEYLDGNAFVVDGEEEAVIKMKDYQGAYVTAYMNSADEIIAVEEVKSVFLTGEFDIAATTSVGATYFAGVDFETADAEYEIKANAITGAAFKTFVNGVEDEIATVTDAATYVMAVKTSGKKITNIYSISVWESAVDVQWTEEMADDLADNDKLADQAFVMTNNDEIDTESFVLEGVKSLDEIEEDDIVTYYLNKNSKIAKVAVSKEVVEGKITKINSDDKAYINGKYYAFTADVEAGDQAIATEGKFYLNAAGKIAVVDATTAAAENYGIVIDTDNGSTGLRGEDALVKMVLADGTVATFSVDVDSDEVEDGDVYGVATSGSVSLSTGAAYKYNVKDGYLTKVATVAAFATADAVDVTAKGTFDGHKIAENVVILGQKGLTATAAAFSTDKDDYEVVKRADLIGQKDVTAKYLTNDAGEIVFMVVKMDGVSGTHAWATVTDVVTLEDDLYEVTFLDGKTYTTEDGSWSVATLYAIDFDAQGYVKDVTGELEAEDALVEVTFAGITTGGQITKVSGGKMYKTVDSEYVYVATLDADVVVYEVNDDATDGEFKVAAASDIKGHDSTVEFYDFDLDKVIDIVVLR